MRKILRCRVTIFLLLGWTIFSVIGYIEKDGIYERYQQDVKQTPYFVLVLHGIHDGIYPWSQSYSDSWEQYAGSGGEDGAEGIAETESTEEQQGQKQPEPTVLKKEFIQVDDSYFDDAVFIGDSRTVGLHDYGGLDNAAYYATVGMNVYDIWSEKFCEVEGQKVTLEEALTARQFKKVYFQIGINEMGRGTIDSFMTAYTQSVQKIHELQPDAIIFVQGIMRVAKAKSDVDPIFNNQGIQLRNERIAKLADNITVFYIDVNEAVCDETGNLQESLTFDNLHLLGSKYNIWVEFLKSKGIEV